MNADESTVQSTNEGGVNVAVGGHERETSIRAELSRHHVECKAASDQSKQRDIARMFLQVVQVVLLIFVLFYAVTGNELTEKERAYLTTMYARHEEQGRHDMHVTAEVVLEGMRKIVGEPLNGEEKEWISNQFNRVINEVEVQSEAVSLEKRQFLEAIKADIKAFIEDSFERHEARVLVERARADRTALNQ